MKSCGCYEPFPNPIKPLVVRLAEVKDIHQQFAMIRKGKRFMRTSGVLFIRYDDELLTLIV